MPIDHSYLYFPRSVHDALMDKVRSALKAKGWFGKVRTLGLPNATVWVPEKCDPGVRQWRYEVSVATTRSGSLNCMYGSGNAVYSVAQLMSHGTQQNKAPVDRKDSIRKLSDSLGGVILCADLVEDEYWEYLLAEAGEVVTEFSSDPGFWLRLLGEAPDRGGYDLTKEASLLADKIGAPAHVIRSTLESCASRADNAETQVPSLTSEEVEASRDLEAFLGSLGLDRERDVALIVCSPPI